MKYKKYFRKTSLKQKGDGEFFLNEVRKKNPKYFLEVGVFHGVTARNICELLKSLHKNNFKYTRAINWIYLLEGQNIKKKFKWLL